MAVFLVFLPTRELGFELPVAIRVGMPAEPLRIELRQDRLEPARAGERSERGEGSQGYDTAAGISS